jgi:magnesium transporter
MLRKASVDLIDDLVVNHARKDAVRISARDTIAQALQHAQHNGTAGRIVYFYVVDDQGRLTGVLPTRRLLLNPPDTAIADIMERNVVTLPATATLVEAGEVFMAHRLLALPVVDQKRRLLGVIDVEFYTEQLSDLVRWKENEHVFQLIGVRLAHVRRASAGAVFGRRFPWLLCNIVGGLACALLAERFQGLLDHVIALALFIPIVLSLAESVSIQSLTLALQFHTAGPLRVGTLLRVCRQEALVGLLLGGAAGGLVGLVVWAWQRQPAVAVAIGGAISSSVLAAALLGLCVPMALRALQRDPKVASGPIALAFTDLATLSCYFGLAACWLGI